MVKIRPQWTCRSHIDNPVDWVNISYILILEWRRTEWEVEEISGVDLVLVYIGMKSDFELAPFHAE